MPSTSPAASARGSRSRSWTEDRRQRTEDGCRKQLAEDRRPTTDAVAVVNYKFPFADFRSLLSVLSRLSSVVRSELSLLRPGWHPVGARGAPPSRLDAGPRGPRSLRRAGFPSVNLPSERTSLRYLHPPKVARKRGTTAFPSRYGHEQEGPTQRETRTMRKALLATTAAVALAMGMSIAAAQGTGGAGGSPGASGGTGGGASHGTMEKQSGGEKGGRASEGRSGSEKGERTGQKAGEKNERMGQKSGEKGERTGQKAGEKNERMGQQPGEKNERTGQKAGEKNERMGQQPGDKNERMGQQPGDKNERMGQQPSDKNQRAGERAGEKNERTGQGTQPNTGTSTPERSQGTSSAKSGELSTEQRTQIRSVVISHREARVDHVDFSISVGTRVPRSVHVVVLPAEAVRIVQHYAGFRYFIVREEIVIVDPDTFEIVAVIPA